MVLETVLGNYFYFFSGFYLDSTTGFADARIDVLIQ